MAVKYLTDGHPDGMIIGSSTDKLGFFGKTATTRRSAPASIGTTATTATLKAAINMLTNALKLKGILV